MAIIYKHTCLISGKCYIGQTVKSLERRWQEHCADAKYNTRRKFMLALKKYGTIDWSHEILFESEDSRVINDKEIEYIKLFDSVKKGYNTSYEKFRNNTLHRAESIEKMKISQKAAHARRRAENNGIEKTKPHKKHVWGDAHPNKGKENKKWDIKGVKGWKIIDGLRVWYVKEAAV